jgi:hypothetical protein
MDSLNFKPLYSQERGSILRMLKLAYHSLPQLDANTLALWERDWAEYDANIFDNPNTVGACGFVSYLNNEVIGFASWDPRQRPIAIVGHNCILPDFRGHMHGVTQMKKVVRRLKEDDFALIRVSTGDNSAFIPAQKMYLSCGFVETRRFEIHGHKMVEFEIR